MARRDADLQHFLDALRPALLSRTPPDGPAKLTTDRIFTALGRAPDGAASAAGTPVRLPACDQLGTAIEAACGGAADLAAVARSFALIEPRLAWRAKPGSTPESAPAPANAMIAGPGGLEPREDVWVGVSLMAPGVVYPDHRHPPEEVYLVLSDGRWRQESGAWVTPGLGGIVYNPPGIVHAMASNGTPLLAVWCLWAGQP